MVRLLLFVSLFSSLTCFAQFQYTLDQSIPVFDLTNHQLAMPWAGGINAAQHNTLDLNGDSNADLVLFDRMANKVMTYLATGNHYLYAPDYEALFPKGIANWILLRDYNCDGKKDLFTSDVLGMRVYTNTTQPGGKLSWQPFYFFVAPKQPKSQVLLTKGFRDLINLQLQYDDLPSIMDADGDGDLDIFAMQYSGNTAEFHRNYSKERYGTCDSLAFERITQTWGNFTDCGCGQFAFNGAPCPPQGGRVEHAGGKSILTFDADGDSDLDFVFSEVSCTNLYLLRNEGTTENPVINTAVTFPVGSPTSFYIFPAAYYEDLDFDGVRDIVATPNIYAKSYFNTDLSSSNWLYKNTGTEQQPRFNFVQNNFLQNEMIDVGDNSIPAFGDFDDDGDYDLFVSQNTSMGFRSTLYAYENTGSKTTPVFTLRNKDYLGFSLSNQYNLKIQFADINGDGNMDLVYTSTSFQNGLTQLYYLPDVFHYSFQPIESLNVTLALADNVYVTDIAGSSDGKPDGLPDLLIGKTNGALEYWENMGALNFAPKNNSFLGIKTSVTRQNPSSVVADLDHDGYADLITGDQSGILTIISNFLEANENSERITETVLSPLTDSTYLARNFGGRVWPTVVNLYDTDKPAIVVGNTLGGIQIIKPTVSHSLTSKPIIQLYPNPLAQQEDLYIRTDRNAIVEVFTSLGQRLSDPVLLKANEMTRFKNNSLAAGVYFFKFTINKKTYTKRIVIY